VNPDSLGTFGELSPDVAEAVMLGDSSNKPKVMGMGIYLEFPNEKGDQTTQILITPQGKDEKGEPVEMAIITRTVSDWSPRKQWRVNLVRPNAPAETMSADDKALSMAEQIERTIKRQMMYGQKTLRGGRPIVFEMTDVDFTEVRAWKAPASALRRIQKARVAIGFPEKLFGTATPTPATI
jgi:hypothetical protein